MTDRSFGNFLSYWVGTVEDVDPKNDDGTKDRDGSHSIRIHGAHDDKTNIPNKKLPRSVFLHSPKSAAFNQMGQSPVGMVKGSTVFGVYLDADKQYMLTLGTLGKAGNPKDGQSVNGQVQVDPATNSNPIGSRSANNAFITRKDKNIKGDDQGEEHPKDTSDKDGKDVVNDAIKKAKFSQMPTIASLSGKGSVLDQLKQVDPNSMGASLPQAVTALLKLKQLMGSSSSSGVQSMASSSVASGISSAATSTSYEYIIQALAKALDSTTISDSTRQVIYEALIQLETRYSYIPDVQVILDAHGAQFANELLQLINSNTLTSASLEALIQKYISKTDDAATAQALGNGANQSNILSMVMSIIPQLGSMINTTMKDHLPNSVLDKSKITEALQKYAKNQSILKKSESGKKALALQATQQSASNMNGDMLNIINNMGLNLNSGQLSQIQNVFGNLIKK